MDAHRPKPSVDYVRLLRRVLANRWHIVVAGFLAISVPTMAWTIFATDNTY